MAEKEQNGGLQPVEKNKKHGSLRTRTITSVVYVVVWVAMVALKWCVPQGNVAGGWGSLGFDAVFCAVSIIGAHEFLRAIGNEKSGINCKISSLQRAITIAFCASIVPLYALVAMIPQTSDSAFLAIWVAFTIYTMLLAASSVFDHEKSTVKGTIYCIAVMLYCGLLSAMLSSVNHLQTNSMSALLMMFICTVTTDVGAYVVGSSLKKYIPLKLAPKLSPNKTVIGAIGGVLGGVVGAIIAYYIMYVFGGINETVYFFRYNEIFLIAKSEYFPPMASFVLIGLVTAVMAQIGDLFESAIKRECGVKDMGNLLPGHGGVLDRFDSMLYSSVVILFAFGTIF